MNTAIPTIHLNGTSKQELLDGYLEVIRALSDAVNKLGKAHPNARDYYVQGLGAINVAQAQHASRIERVCDVITELEAIAIGIADQ